MLKYTLIVFICCISTKSQASENIIESFQDVLTRCHQMDKKSFISTLKELDKELHDFAAPLSRSQFEQTIADNAKGNDISTLEWAFITLGEPYSPNMIRCWDHLYEAQKMLDAELSEKGIKAQLDSWKSCQYDFFRPTRNAIDMKVVDALYDCFSYHDK